MRVRNSMIVLALLTVALGAGSENTSSGTAGAGRPNIIFILTDDLDAQSPAAMPKLKALLRDQGVSFSNFFVSFSLCCPSRATILRGQYAHNTEILGNRPPDGGFEKFYSLGEERSTVATWLQAAGYRTMYVGKYLNGYPANVGLTYVPPGWDEWYSAVSGNPYSEYNYTLNENGTLVRYGSKPEDYGTDVYVRKATDFIRRMAQEGKPFFIHLSVYAPHSPATPAPRHENMFPNARAPRTPNFNEEDVSDKPAYIRNRPPFTSREIALIDEQYRKRLRSLQAVDEAIESLIQTLQATGQLDKTYIFFTSDNGFHLGNHRLAMGKVAPYEEDIRVPLIVRGPGVPAGRTVEHLAGNVDLAPTWAELAGVKVPDFVDGRSLLPLLGDFPPPLASWRQALLLENGTVVTRNERETDPSLDLQEGVWEPEDALPERIRQRPRGTIPAYRGIRTRNHLYVEYATGERELYDVRSDPYQLQNLYETADPQLRAQLSAWLAALSQCRGAECRAVETAPVALPSIGRRLLDAQDVRGAIEVKGQRRTFWVHLPPAFEDVASLPVVLAFHGGGGTGQGMKRLTGFDGLADREGFLVVYPDGINNHWNDGRPEIARWQGSDVDDVAFVRALIEHLVGMYKADRRRIFATGISNGALFSFRLACELSDKIAAIAAVAAPMGEDLASRCFHSSPPTHPTKPSSPSTRGGQRSLRENSVDRFISVLLMHGTEDPLVPWEGGEILGNRGRVLSVPQTISLWARHNRCESPPVITELPDLAPRDGTRVERHHYERCAEGSEVVLYSIRGGGHTWPGGWQYLPEFIIGRTSRDINASDMIWRFFARHGRNVGEATSSQFRTLQERRLSRL